MKTINTINNSNIINVTLDKMSFDTFFAKDCLKGQGFTTADDLIKEISASYSIDEAGHIKLFVEDAFNRMAAANEGFANYVKNVESKNNLKRDYSMEDVFKSNFADYMDYVKDSAVEPSKEGFIEYVISAAIIAAAVSVATYEFTVYAHRGCERMAAESYICNRSVLDEDTFNKYINECYCVA